MQREDFEDAGVRELAEEIDLHGWLIWEIEGKLRDLDRRICRLKPAKHQILIDRSKSVEAAFDSGGKVVG